MKFNLKLFSFLTLVFYSSVALAVYKDPPYPIAIGGTGKTTAAAAFNALSPMTSSGDIIYGGTAGAATRLAAGSNTQVLTLVSGIPAWASPSGSVTAVYAHLRLNANYSPAANAVIKFDTVTDDTNTAYSTSTGLYTVPTAGNYLMCFTGINVTSAAGVYIEKNGTAGAFISPLPTSNYGGGCQSVVAAVNDTLGFYSDTGINVTGNSSAPYKTTASISLIH